MAASRHPGSIGQGIAPHHIDDGTLNRQRSPRPGAVCNEDRLAVVRYAYNAMYVRQAWDLSQRYALDATIKHAGKDFAQLIEGLIPGMLMALGGVLVTTAIGAALGGALGAAAGGVGAVPGAVGGAEVGMSIGVLILEWIGIGFLVVYIGESVGQAGEHFVRGTKMAWASCGANAQIDAAAREIAEGIGCFNSLIAQGLVAYVAKEGIAAATNRLGKTRFARGLVAYLESLEFESKTTAHYLKLLGRPREPKLVQQRVFRAVKFLRDPNGASLKEGQILDALRGIDFNSEVEIVTLDPGETLVSNVIPTTKTGEGALLGNWFTRSGFSAESTGIAKGNRVVRAFKVKRPVRVLKSRASGIVDTWTEGRTNVRRTGKVIKQDKLDEYGKYVRDSSGKKVVEKKYVYEHGEYASGGGEQLFIVKPEGQTGFQGLLEEIKPPANSGER